MTTYNSAVSLNGPHFCTEERWSYCTETQSQAETKNWHQFEDAGLKTSKHTHVALSHSALLLLLLVWAAVVVCTELPNPFCNIDSKLITNLALHFYNIVGLTMDTYTYTYITHSATQPPLCSHLASSLQQRWGATEVWTHFFHFQTSSLQTRPMQTQVTSLEDIYQTSHSSLWRQ